MYSRDEVTKMVHDAVTETFDLKEDIANSDISFREDLEADSIDMVSLALVLEEEFSADIDDDQVENFVTINKVIDYIMERQNLPAT